MKINESNAVCCWIWADTVTCWSVAVTETPDAG
jgi:hypothetical protein